MGLLLVYVIIRSVLAAAGKPFWYDELFTLTVSSLGSWSAIVNALRKPLDTQPPLFYVIEHFALRFTQNQEIALRLPSILAFPCTLVCVFLYVKKKSGEIVAFLSAVFLMTTSVFQEYAVEARPYSMVIACIAFALVCYQRVPSPVWTALLALSLALAQSLHYLAVLAMVPFGLAEAVHFWNTRKFRWPVWAALAAGAVPLLLFWNLLANIKAYYGGHFWARFPFSSIPHSYGELLQISSPSGLAVAAVALAGVIGTALWERHLKTGDATEKSEDLAEAALLFALAALPFEGYLLASIVHTALVPRYFLSVVIGVSIAIGYILSRARLAGVALFAVFVFSAVGVSELHFWRFFREDMRNVKSSGESAERFIDGAGHKELPVLVPNPLEFFPLVHYTSPPIAGRLVYPTRERRLNDEEWSDSVDKESYLLKSYIPIRVGNVPEVTSARREFLVYLEEKEPGVSWLIPYLIREGWTLQIISLDGDRKLYLVSEKRMSSPQ